LRNRAISAAALFSVTAGVLMAGVSSEVRSLAF
jgi:hypothetical protein